MFKKGFTLIELLIVVAIISILAAIALPNFLDAVERTHSAACKSNLKTLATALVWYRLDYGELPPADGTAGPDPSPDHTTPGKGPAAGGSWDGVPRALISNGYVTDEKVLYCPSMAKRYKDRKEYVRYAYNSSAFDTFGHSGGADNIEKGRGDVWMLRCMWVPPEYSFNPRSGLEYPHGDYIDEEGVIHPNAAENVLYRSGMVETRDGHEDFMESFFSVGK